MFSKPKGRKNLEFRGKEITVDIKNWNFLSEGLSTKHICKLLKKEKSSIISLEVETRLVDLHGEGRVFFFFFSYANIVVNDVSLGL